MKTADAGAMPKLSRLDAQIAAHHESGMGGVFSPVALCRQLETELTAATEQITRLEGYREHFSTVAEDRLKLIAAMENQHEADCETMGKQAKRIYAQDEQIAALKADAERYRWLRDTPSPTLFVIQQIQDEGGSWEEYTMQNHRLDSAIDAARGGEIKP